ncbi:MAG: FlgD immunoglobulin-like domain containing protein, partial [bacterium]
VQNSTHVMVYESRRGDSLDWQKVWEWEPYFPGSGAATYITDADKDGRNELFVSFPSWLLDFETTGDNTYTEVWRDSIWDPLPDGAYLAFGDFDSDGNTEFVTSSVNGWYYVFENADSAIDDYELVRIDSVADMINADYTSASPDMDGDGKPEFMIAGNRNGVTGWTWQMDVFEATGDNSYQVVWFDSVADCPWLNDSWISCGDVDGDSVNEILWGIGQKGLFLYDCIAPDLWQRVWEYPLSDRISSVLVYDVNKNGYAEMIVACLGRTLIFEKEGVGVGEWERQARPDHVFLSRNSPNPFSSRTSLEYELGQSSPVYLEVYDIAGRLKRTLIHGAVVSAGRHSISWDGTDELGNRLTSGVYFARLRAANTHITRKMLLLR